MFLFPGGKLVLDCLEEDSEHEQNKKRNCFREIVAVGRLARHRPNPDRMTYFFRAADSRAKNKPAEGDFFLSLYVRFET